VPAGALARRSTAAATGIVALGLGVACGLGVDALRGPDAPEAEAPLPATPEACAVAQVAWSRAASAQASMSQDEPATLREGYLGARDVMDGVEPPPAVADEWGTYVSYVDTVAASVADVTDDAAIADAVGSALAGLDTAEVMAAAERITAYLQADCRPEP
jgi:hypothetical protein